MLKGKKDSAPRKIQGGKGLVKAVQVQRTGKTKGQQCFPGEVGGEEGHSGSKQCSKLRSQTLTRKGGSSHKLS